MAEYDESGSDYDDPEDAMFPGPLPVLDVLTAEEQAAAVLEAAEEQQEQYELDQQWRARRRELRRERALISRFERTRRSPAFHYDLKALAQHREVREYFAHRHHFRYVKTLRGGGGRASLFAEVEVEVEGGGDVARGTVERRRVVVKLGRELWRILEEMEWLNTLTKLEHVVNVIYLNDEDARRGVNPIAQVDEEDESDEEEGEGDEEGQEDEEEDQVDPAEVENEPSSSFWGSIRNHPFWNREPIVIDENENQNEPPPPKIPSRPTLVLEYMESGDLHELRERMKAAGVQPPMRFLWRVLLCLLRACAGLAYYEHLEEGREGCVKGQRPGTLAHGALDLSHILIGALTPDDPDHGLVPVLKMCSFGGTMDKPTQPDGRGLIENIRAMGRILETLAVPSSEAIDPEDGLLPLTPCDVDTGQSVIPTLVHDHFISDAGVAPAFRVFVARMMAENAVDMFPIKVMLRRVELIVNGLSSSEEEGADFGGDEVAPAAETDAAVAQFVQTFCFDASADPPLPPPEGADGGGGDSSEPGPLSRIFEATFGSWLGTGTTPGLDDFDPASFHIPDLPIDPPEVLPPDPASETIGIWRDNMTWPIRGRGGNRGRNRRGRRGRGARA